jgi:hypothetical protein
MEWRFWKWARTRKRKSGVARTQAPRLPKPYSYRQVIALQKTVGNQAVLWWLGLRK